jgi:hypothetical protein
MSSGVQTFEITSIEGLNLVKDTFFNILVATGAPNPLQLISNVVGFFKDGFIQNEKSVWDQVKEQVIQEVLRGVTEYHKAVLNVKLQAMDSKMMDIIDIKLHTPSNYKAALLSTSKYLSDLR